MSETTGKVLYNVTQGLNDYQKDLARTNIGAAAASDLSTLADSIADPATANPVMDGTAAVGASSKYAREDHVHPTDTSREAVSNKTTVVLGTSDSQYPTDRAVAEFVNSSIATNTAHYISDDGDPFTSVANLEAYTGTVTNNDYAFVTGVDSDGNTYYDRYKATVDGSTATWALEYRLNNSSFTAAQWAAINSGITAALVSKIHEHSNKSVLDGITETNVSSWNGKKDKQSAVTFTGSTLKTPTSMTQDANGELAVTFTDIQSASTSQKGVVQLSDAVNSTDTDKAATANAVKQAYDLAASKQGAVSTDTDSSDFSDDTTVATGFGSDKIHLNVASRLWNYIKGKLGISSSGSSTKFLNEQGEWTTVNTPDMSGKADKVSGATAGDVATLDENGNLVDSGVTLGTSVPTDAAFTDDKVAQMKADSSDTAYPLLMAGTTDPSGRATVARYDSGVTLNPSTNIITANISGNAATADLASATSSGAIQGGDDLNSYNVANRTYLCSAANATTVTNKPAGASDAFELEVIRGTGDTCVQVYYSRDDVNYNYIRKRTGLNGGTWTNWERISVGSTAGDVEHPCYVSGGVPMQCYGVSTYSLFYGSLNNSSWTSISGTVSPSGNSQYILTDTSTIDLRKTGGTHGNTGSMHIRVKGDGNACRTLTVKYLDVFGNTRSFELYWGNSSHFTRVNEFVVFWAESLFSLNQSINRHCTIVPVRLPELGEWDGESV